MKALSVEFCQNSSLHGLHYLVVSGKSVLERILWAILLSCVSVLLVAFVYRSWCKLFEGPVLVFVEDPNYSLDHVDFPTVTICPNIKVLQHKVDQFIGKYNISEEHKTAFERSILAFSLLRYPFYNLPQKYVDSVNKSLYPVPPKDILDIMRDVGPDINDSLFKCKWRSVTYKCKFLFQRQMTQEGFCFTFNGITHLKYIRSISAPELPNTTSVPFRTNMYGRISGLGVRLLALRNDKLNNAFDLDGYSIFVHHSSVVPDLSQVITVVPNDSSKMHDVIVSAFVTEAEKSLFNLKESVRDCSFSIYEHCLINCQESVMLEYCGCLPYNSLKADSNNTCGVQHLQCLSNISPRLQSNKVSASTPGFPNWSLPLFINCNCRHQCSYTTYSSQLNVHSTDKREWDSYSNLSWTRLRVYYNSFAIKYVRTVPYDFRSFLIRCGSSAGLLLGFSAVAFFDFVLYLCKILHRSLYTLNKTHTKMAVSKINYIPRQRKKVSIWGQKSEIQ